MNIKGIVICIMFIYNINASEELSFAIGEWQPYVSDKMDGYGLAAEIVTAACNEAGLKANYNFYPWLRAERNVLKGQEFATFPFQKKNIRKNQFDFSYPIIVSSNKVVYLTKPENFLTTNIENFTSYRIGMTIGDYHAEELLNIGAIVDMTQTIDLSVKKLKLGRIDFIIDDEIVIRKAIKKLYPDIYKKFKFSNYKINEDSIYYIMVSKKIPESKTILEKLNFGLRIIYENGIMKDIYSKYDLLFYYNLLEKYYT